MLGFGMNPPKVGFTSAETFACKLPFGTFILRYVPMLVVVALMWLLLCALVLHALGAGGLTLPIGLILTAAFLVASVVAYKVKFDRTWGRTELELSPAGATVLGGPNRLHLPWDRVRLGAADLVNSRHTTFGPVGARLLYSLLVLASRRPAKPALVGSGAVIMLTIYDKDWAGGRIGDWIRAYRPDLLAHP